MGQSLSGREKHVHYADAAEPVSSGPCGLE